MRLQKQLSKRVGNIEYPKYVVNITPDKIKEVGWKAGQELEIIVKGKEIILKPKKI